MERTITKNDDRNDTVSSEISDKLGFERKDYDGYEFTMLISDGDSFEHYAEKLTGSLVSDAVYTRNTLIEEFFNIDLNIIPKPCNWEDREDFVGGIKNLILSGEKSYDAVVGIVGVMATGFSSEYFLNVGNMQYIDLSKDYWVKNQYEELNVNGKLFALSGDMNLTLYGNMYGVFFNTRVVQDNHLDSIYDIVSNNQWTLEKMRTMAAQVGNDLGDAGIELGEDMLGIICQTNSSRGFMTACGVDIFQRANDGTVSIQTSASDKYIDIYTRVSNMLNESTNYKTPDLNESIEQLASGNVLFAPMYLKTIEDARIKDVLDNVGIVPYPLYDEMQESYITPLTCNVTTFPINVSNAELSAQVATYMAYCGQEQLAPKYFETHIKSRLASEPAMQVMLDLMRDTAIYTSELCLIMHGELPSRHPKISTLKAGEKLNYQVVLFNCDGLSDYAEQLYKTVGIPFLGLESCTVFGNERPTVKAVGYSDDEVEFFDDGQYGNQK